MTDKIQLTGALTGDEFLNVVTAAIDGKKIKLSENREFDGTKDYSPSDIAGLFNQVSSEQRTSLGWRVTMSLSGGLKTKDDVKHIKDLISGAVKPAQDADAIKACANALKGHAGAHNTACAKGLPSTSSSRGIYLGS